MSDGPCIIVLLACHVSSQQRLDYLLQCLRSVGAQEQLPEALYLSWTAQNTELMSSATAALAAMQLPFRLVLLPQPQHRLSQYEHLSHALAGADRESTRRRADATWLVFSDDDDLWHPRRTSLVWLACAATPATTEAIVFPIYAYPLDERAQAARTCAEVDACLSQRAAALWIGPSEVFQFAVRPGLLRRFLASEPPAVLRHRFADVRFAQYVRQQHKRHVRVPSVAQLMSLDGGGATAATPPSQLKRRGGNHGNAAATDVAPATPAEEKWLLANWMYFYRNTRQLAAAQFLGSLEDLHAGNGAGALPESEHGGGGSGEGAEGYERASTGAVHCRADRAIALRVLKALDVPPSERVRKAGGGGPTHHAPPPPPPPTAEEVDAVTGEVARHRHHAELAAMMCLHVRNAPEVALEICASEHGAESEGGSNDESRLRSLLRAEQAALVREACEMFGHGSRGELPVGTLQDCVG